MPWVQVENEWYWEDEGTAIDLYPPPSPQYYDDLGITSDSKILKCWRRAIRYIGKLGNSEIKMPNISSGPDDSVDIHWEQEDYELFINVKQNENEKATYYGDNYGDIKIEGTLDIETDNGQVWRSLMEKIK